MEKFKNTDLLNLLRIHLGEFSQRTKPLDIYDKRAHIFFDGRLVVYHQEAHITNYIDHYKMPPWHLLNTMEYQMYFSNKIADKLACASHIVS